MIRPTRTKARRDPGTRTTPTTSSSWSCARLRIQIEDGDVELGPGQFVVVPRAVRHNPVAAHECWVVFIETVTTLHTGDIVTPRTRSIAEQMR